MIKARYWSFIPRRGSGRTQPPFAIRADLVGPAAERARGGGWLSAGELTALFAETRPDAVEHIREAADELRAEVAGDAVTFVVNRNHQRFERVHRGATRSVGSGKAGALLTRKSTTSRNSSDVLRRRLPMAPASCAFSPGSTLTGCSMTISVGCAYRSAWRRTCIYTPTRPWRSRKCRTFSGLSLAELFARLKNAGLGSTPGTAAEVLHGGVRERISPNKLPVARWVEIVEASHAAGLRSTSTVMFGHVEEPWELAELMRVIRALQERTGGITEFVPLSFIPFHTLLGRTHGSEEISREESLKRTAVFRLALGRSIANVQASWVKLGLDTATESLRWGVNDLGGTLMEESISRLAGSYHGTKLDPDQLVAAAHDAGRPAAERTTLYDARHHHPVPSDALLARPT